MAKKKFLTEEFIVSFPYVFHPYAYKGKGDPRYSITMLFDKQTNLTGMKNFFKEIISEKWPKGLPEGFINPFRDGSKKDPEKYKGYANKIFVKASSSLLFKPGISEFDPQGEIIPIIDEKEFYSGCRARASVTVYTYENGASFGLANVLKVADGERLYTNSTPEEDFASIVMPEIEEILGGETSILDL